MIMIMFVIVINCSLCAAPIFQVKIAILILITSMIVTHKSLEPQFWRFRLQL